MITSKPTSKISTAFRRFTTLAAAAAMVACGGGSEVEDSRRAPLAVTTTASGTTYERDDLYRFFTIAFGAAPGVTYMGQLLEAANAGMSIKAIVNVFTTKTQFTDVYPTTLTNQEFASKLVDNVVGSSATAASKAAAVSDIVAALKLPTWTRGDVVHAVFNNLATKPATDPDWAGTAKKMANQVQYAKYFTETMAVDTLDLPKLRAVVGAVTESSTVAGDLSGAILAAIGQISTPVSSLVFASGYTNKDVDTVTFARAGRSVEGGSFNWYQDAAANDWSNFWWNGISALTEGAPNFYFGLGFASSTGVPFVGAFVNAANDTSIKLQGQTKMKIAVWGNDELTSRKLPTFTVFVQLKEAFAGCYVEAMAPTITPPGIGPQTYTVNLADFTIKNNCANSGVETATDVFKKPIGSVHVQVLKANMFFNGTGLSPNGINLGPVSFEP
jgi:hypothetical protein